MKSSDKGKIRRRRGQERPPQEKRERQSEPRNRGVGSHSAMTNVGRKGLRAKGVMEKRIDGGPTGVTGLAFQRGPPGKCQLLTGQISLRKLEGGSATREGGARKKALHNHTRGRKEVYQEEGKQNLILVGRDSLRKSA